MGKQREQKKKPGGGKSHGSNKQQRKKKTCEDSQRPYDKDTMAFISLSQELKEEGNRLFQSRDYEEAMFLYEKAITFLPRNHPDVSYLHSNMAACYMQLGESEYPRAIHECNLALEVDPKCTKALLKRSRCYEGLVRLDLAQRDAMRVLRIEPNNFMAAEIVERVKATIDSNGGAADIPVDLIPVPEYVEPPVAPTLSKSSKGKARKKKCLLKIEKKKGNDGDGNGRKRRRKKAKKKVRYVGKARDNEDMEDQESEDIFLIGSGINAQKAKERIEGKEFNNAFRHDSDLSGDDEDESLPGKNVEYNRFEVLNDDSKEEEEEEEEGKPEIGIYDLSVQKNKNKRVPRGKQVEERRAEDKLVVREIKNCNNHIRKGESSSRRVKLIYGDDIRIAHVPTDSDILGLREIVCNRFPNCKSILIKYKDEEGDLVTITTNEELRWAETSSSSQHCLTRLFIIDVNPGQDPLLEEKIKREKAEQERKQNEQTITDPENDSDLLQITSSCVDDWIIHFAYLFKQHATGIKSGDCFLGLHDVGVKAYSEAMEETVTSEEAQDIFSTAEEKFREMASLALFSWGNIHMSKARRRVFTEYSATTVREDDHEWAQKEYSMAGRRFEEALKINPSFYECIIALGQLQFEQAKLSWYHHSTTTTTTSDDLLSLSALSEEVLQLYRNAGKNMERGIHMWEEALVQHLIEVTNESETDRILEEMKLGNLFKVISAEETAELAANIRSQVNLLWGTMLYERSVLEFKLELPSWQNCLEAAADKLELAGASPEDIAVMIKNHCSNSLQGVDNVEETEQAWNEMYEAIRWQMDIPALHLESLLQKRVANTHHAALDPA
ncbi:unnamed protein product [Cuscuta epithymum]|uniref:PB1 domain-containing protein n=1 Tax=Cuscuta epithymum TaxID=186058 RepID=A0AAV0CHH7_9ASTE|nr:unnamed protein product [Cuscuta epithymum]